MIDFYWSREVFRETGELQTIIYNNLPIYQPIQLPRGFQLINLIDVGNYSEN